jgi:predicted RNA binding protein YcfA (HicA-like mRNA interferase family)
MLALPHLSGTECIAVLSRLGFRCHRRAGGLATLERGIDRVIVPESATLGPALLGAILRAAGVDALEFLHAMDAIESAPVSRPPESASALA